jgi:hypothetical protein
MLLFYRFNLQGQTSFLVVGVGYWETCVYIVIFTLLQLISIFLCRYFFVNHVYVFCLPKTRVNLISSTSLVIRRRIVLRVFNLRKNYVNTVNDIAVITRAV